MSMRNIKDEYRKYVISYFIIYIVVNIVIVFINLNIIQENWLEIIKNNEFIIKPIYSIIFIPLVMILALIVMNFFPSKIKDVLIFWKIKNALPGYRWQSDIAIKDSKLNLQKLNKKYENNLSPKEQQNIWYEAYQKCKGDEAILESQKNYLFARDLCTTTVLILPVIFVIYILGKIFFNLPFSFFIINLMVLIVFYLLLVYVTRNCANRFVCNVLSIDSTKD